MVVARVVATPSVAEAQAAHGGDRIGVVLYHGGAPTLPGLGAHLHLSSRRLPARPSTAAWDFLSIALAAFAADRFILRSEAEDGWTRAISISVALANPTPWSLHRTHLEAALRFLTGDIWQVSVREGGAQPPALIPQATDRDTIALFSGGLDSFLGAAQLISEGRKPLLVSQGSPKEIGPQQRLARELGLHQHRFDGRVHERWRAPYEGSTRSRSLIFFAYGVVAASAHGLCEVIVPENGLIAINPPFTRRRLGSLSTRTTHPYFLTELEAIFRGVGLNVRLTNIFEGKTKGEMMTACQLPNLAALASVSYSCGKGKRRNGQCGRCVPCLIRRAAFARAGIADGTSYFSDIVRSSANDDVLAARIAVEKMRHSTPEEIARWATMSGPLPTDATRRRKIVDTVGRGIVELGSYLDGVAWR